MQQSQSRRLRQALGLIRTLLDEIEVAERSELCAKLKERDERWRAEADERFKARHPEVAERFSA